MGIPAASVPADPAVEEAKVKTPRTRNRTLITPEGISIPITVASRLSRFGALVLDFVILYLGLTVFVAVMVWIAGGLFERLLLVRKMKLQVDLKKFSRRQYKRFRLDSFPRGVVVCCWDGTHP